MNCIKQVYLLGVNYRTASAGVRGQLAYHGADAVRLLKAIKDQAQDVEALVLSTCLRSEFYLAAPEGVNPLELCWNALDEMRPDSCGAINNCTFYIKRDEMAVAHLFTVAAGLDSVLLGDQQILAQLKDASNWAREAGSLGFELNELIRMAQRVGKRSRSETQISHGAATLGAALLRTIHQRGEDGARPRVLILGAGCIARDVARQFSKHGIEGIRIANRTPETAEEIAHGIGGFAIPWDWVPGQLSDIDLLVAATSASSPIIPTEWLEREAARRAAAGERPLLLVDAGLPRNIADGPGERINVEAIREQREHVLKIREAAVPAVRTLVQAELAGWKAWREAQPVERELKMLFLDWARMSAQSDKPGKDGNRVAALLHRHAIRLRRLNRPQVFKAD